MEAKKDNNAAPNEIQGVEIEQISKKIKQKLNSPFLNKAVDWTNEDHFVIPKDLLDGITKGLGFPKPSKIQTVGIPLILEKDENGQFSDLIAQAKNGSGKTGTFVIGSLLRVDRTIKKPQVIVLVHTRELGLQIFEVYKKAVEYTNGEITVQNMMDQPKPTANILIITIDKLIDLSKGRGGMPTDALKMFIVDEADVFFENNRDEKKMEALNDFFKKLKNKPQYVLISATFSPDVSEKIAEFVKEANQISMKIENQELKNIQQFYHRVQKREKPDFIMKIFEIIQGNQTMIFVNTIAFAETLFNILRKNGFKCSIFFSKMTKEERDEIFEKFRNQEIKILITTNLLSRGIDVPEIDLVINFDVPKIGLGNGVFEKDPETYLHRIGRAGRFGIKGVALTLFDNDDDERVFFEIADTYLMRKSVMPLETPERLKKALAELDE